MEPSRVEEKNYKIKFVTFPKYILFKPTLEHRENSIHHKPVVYYSGGSDDTQLSV